jgi:hypothetical protein
MNWISWSCSLLVGVVLGLIAGRLPCVSFTDNIDLDSLAGLLVSLVVFLGLNLMYQTQFSTKRTEKDLVISLVKDAIEAADGVDRQFRLWYRENPLSDRARNEITSSIQRYTNALHSVRMAFKECKFDQDKLGFSEAEELRSDYREMLTDTPFPERYEDSILRAQQGHHKKVRDSLHKIVLKLNRI